MAKTDFQNIDQYHAIFPSEVVERMETIRGIIKKEVPEAEEVISYQIPAFKFHGFLIYYSAYKSHISLSHPFSAALLNEFKTELANYKVSKSAIQLPLEEPLPVALIKKLIQFRKKENLAAATAKAGTAKATTTKAPARKATTKKATKKALVKKTPVKKAAARKAKAKG